jgi:rubrerythrin
MVHMDLRGGRAAQTREGASRARGDTRSRHDVVRRGAGLAALVVAGGALGARRLESAFAAAPSAAQDEQIFNYALLLEYLQDAFYSGAVAAGALRGEVREFAETVAGHERAHVDYIRKALGAKARPKPQFRFGTATKSEREFLKNAVLLENLAVAAYNGQAANLTKPALAAAVEIVSVEGRHAAWVSDLASVDPAPRAADPGASAAAVVAELKRTGFVKTR